MRLMLPMEESISETPRASRQLKLFQTESPLLARLGLAFFHELPMAPGVYFFRGANQELLYIGQSANLRHRLNSYRHVTPEKNPRRTLRLIQRTMSIDFERCETAGEAINRERVLLLEHRPPFNRAGVWEGDAWWLTAQIHGERLHLTLSRQRGEEDAMGPLPASFRHVWVSLLRCIIREQEPERSYSEYPHGLTHYGAPKAVMLVMRDPQAARLVVQAFAVGQGADYLTTLAQLPLATTETEQAFWLEELEVLQQYLKSCLKRGPITERKATAESPQKTKEERLSTPCFPHFLP